MHHSKIKHKDTFTYKYICIFVTYKNQQYNLRNNTLKYLLYGRALIV